MREGDRMTVERKLRQDMKLTNINALVLGPGGFYLTCMYDYTEITQFYGGKENI